MENERVDLRYIYSWEWFKYHAAQRLATFNFFLIVTGIIGYGLILANEDSIKKLLCVVGFIMPITFWLLEIRNEELVNYGREALKGFEKEKDIKLITTGEYIKRAKLPISMDCLSRFILAWKFGKAKKWRKGWIKHHFIFRLIFFATSCLFAYMFFRIQYP